MLKTNTSTEAILNDLNIGVFQFAASGDVVFLNTRFKEQINSESGKPDQEIPENLLSGKLRHAILQKIRSFIPDVLQDKQAISRVFCVNDKYYLLEVRFSVDPDRELFTGMLTDITESRLTQQKLHNRQRELISLMDNLPGMAFRCKYDQHWTMIFLSQACKDLTGYAKEDLLWNKMLSYVDLVFPDDRKWVENTVQKAVDKHKRYQVEYRIVDKAGKIKWMYEQAKAYVNKNGEIEFIEGIILDITSRKYAEKVQRAVGLIAEMSVQKIDFDNQTYFRNVQNLITSFMNAEYFSVVYYDAQNDQLKVLYSSDNIMLDDLKEVDIPRETLSYKVLKENRSLLLDKDKIREMEKHGDIKIYGKEAEQWLGIPMQLTNGNKGAVVVQNYESEVNFTNEDLKSLELIVHQVALAINRRDAVEALARREGYYRNLYMNLPVSYQTLDEEGNILIVNERWLEVLGYSSDQVTGKSFGEFWAEKEQALEFSTFWKNFLNAGYIDRQLIKIQKSNGEKCDVILTGHKEADQLGTFIRAHFVFVDVTVVIQAEEAMRQAKEKAEENDTLKSAFLANMSHEIRSPMNAILGFSDLLRNPNLHPEKKEKFIQLIHERGEDLLRIIDDIVDFSKLEAGTLKLHYDYVNMQEFIGNLEISCRQEQKRLRKENVNLAVERNNGIYDENWFIDPVRVRQILINLINNALKFTSEGYVRLAITKSEDKIMFSVLDTGIGIAEQKQSFIFERFRQVDLEYKTTASGTGLGLSISKNLAEQMEGRLTVESQPGEGSIFTLILPFYKGAIKSGGKLQKNASEEPLRKTDESVVRRIAIYNLTQDDVVSVQNALNDLDIQFVSLSEHQWQYNKEKINSLNFDLILVGCFAGDGKVYEIIPKLREIYTNTHVIALLHKVSKAEKEKLKHTGIDDYIDMPVSDLLLKTVLMKRND